MVFFDFNFGFPAKLRHPLVSELQLVFRGGKKRSVASLRNRFGQALWWVTRGFEDKVVRRWSGGNRWFVIILRKKIHSKANIKSPFITITNHHPHHFTFAQCGWLMSVAGGSDCKHTCLLIYPTRIIIVILIILIIIYRLLIYPITHPHLHHCRHHCHQYHVFFLPPASWQHHYCPHPYLLDDYLQQPLS